MAWIESHTTLSDHPKTRKLMRLLDTSKAATIGHLHCLWWWAIDYAVDGDLTRFDALDISIACEWEGVADALVEALVKAGFLDRDGDSLTIHDWPDYAGRLIEQREHRAQRARRNRGLYNDDELIRIVRSRDGDTCRYCGQVVNWLDRKGASGGTYDHIDPNATPENTPENVVVACRSCNASKGKRTPEQAGMILLVPTGNQPSTAGDGKKTAVNQPTNLTRPNQTRPGGDSPPNPPGGGDDQRFEQFWSVYPKRVGKDAARKAWDKRKPSAELTEQIVAAVNVQRQSLQWCKDGGQFIPNPATWLNQGRWQDDPAPDVPTLTVHQGSGSRASPKDEGMSKYDLAAYARELERRNA